MIFGKGNTVVFFCSDFLLFGCLFIMQRPDIYTLNFIESIVSQLLLYYLSFFIPGGFMACCKGLKLYGGTRDWVSYIADGVFNLNSLIQT